MMDYLAPLVGEGEDLLAQARAVPTARRAGDTGGKDRQAEVSGVHPWEATDGERSADVPRIPFDRAGPQGKGEDFLTALLAGQAGEAALPPEDDLWQGNWSLEETLARTAQAVQGVPGQSRTVTVPLPESPSASRGEEDWAALDRAVERDARRYDRGFPLY